MTTIEAYRIAIRNRESGETVEIVNNYDGQPLTLESAHAFAALRRALLPNVFGDDKGTLLIDVEEIEPEQPQSVAERWLAGEHIYPKSGEQIAACLRWLADMIADVGHLPSVYLTVGMQVTTAHGGSVHADRMAAVDEISAALGQTAADDETSYSMRGGHHYVAVYAPHTKPTPAQVAEAALTPDALYDASVEDEPTDPQPTPADGTPRVDAEV